MPINGDFWHKKILVMASAILASFGASADPIPMQTNWVTMEKAELVNGFKLFRRYGFIQDGSQSPFANLMIFNCSRDVRKKSTHLTIVLPKSYQPTSFRRETWVPIIAVRFLSQNWSFTLSGEYRNGEFFFDLTGETKEAFSKILYADNLSMGFGKENDIIEWNFTQRMDGAFAELVQTSNLNSQFGHVMTYANSGLFYACDVFARTGR